MEHAGIGENGGILCSEYNKKYIGFYLKFYNINIPRRQLIVKWMLEDILDFYN